MHVSSFMPEICSRKATMTGSGASGATPWASSARRYPAFATPGNHDLHRVHGSADSNEVLSVSPLWRHHFALPTNGPKGVDELKEQSYYIDYQGVRFISLDVNVYANEAFSASAKQRVGNRAVGVAGRAAKK